MSVIKGDFLGFTFDNIHSSELGIFRVSDGSRYSENLLPTIQDKTTQVPGADGTYFHGSYYTQKPFNISISFDDLTEVQLRKIKRVFGDKGIHKLIFDELPFKEYKVKVTGTPNLKYVCFDEPVHEYLMDGEEIDIYSSKEDLYNIHSRRTTIRKYKGEGQLNFVAYIPYAKSRFKYIEDYTLKNIPEWGSMDENSANTIYYNLNEWLEAGRLKKKSFNKKVNGVTYVLDKYNAGKILLYNAGDVETPINFVIEGFTEDKIIFSDESLNNLFIISKFDLEDSDDSFRINTRLHLIEGLRQGEPTGTIYNKYISGGDFFKIPPTEEPVLYDVYGASAVEVKYDYLYY